MDRFAEPRNVPLKAHIEQWKRSLTASGRGDEYITLKLTRVRAAFDGCGFHLPADLRADRRETFLHDLREEEKRSVQTANDWLQAVRQFVRLMVANDRIDRDPFARLQRGNAKFDQRRRRSEFTLKRLRNC